MNHRSPTGGYTVPARNKFRVGERRLHLEHLLQLLLINNKNFIPFRIYSVCSAVITCYRID